jgi:alkylation response protein AidB-like acyl-CoA dehydrogenase
MRTLSSVLRGLVFATVLSSAFIEPSLAASTALFIQQVVGELTAVSHAIDVLVRENARTLGLSSDAILRADPGADHLVLQSALATARTQIVVGKLALQAGERLFDAGGTSATSRKHNFDRHWRNLRTIFSHNPLHHKAKVIGDYVLNPESFAIPLWEADAIARRMRQG